MKITTFRERETERGSNRAPLSALFLFLIISHSAFSQVSTSIQKADSLFLKQQWQQAIREYESIRSKDGKLASLSLNRLGFSYHNVGNYDKALLNYRESLANQPAKQMLPVLYSRISRVLSVQNNTGEAFTNLQKALDEGYGNINELQTSKDFTSIRSDDRFPAILDRATKNAYPCMKDPQAREFDFWVGEWDVYVTGTTNLAGQSKIEKASGECMILENWAAVGSPNNGKSMNFINPQNKKWEQVWVGSGGPPNHVGRFYNGEYRDNAMRFDFEQTSPTGQKLTGRFTFFNQGPDQVRQLNEVSSDGGTTWSVNYDLTYKRRK